MSVVAGCSGAGEDDVVTSTVTTTVEPSPATAADADSDAGSATSDEGTAANTSDDESACADLTAEQAMDRWIGDVPPHVPPSGGGGDRWEWYPERLDAKTYDPCADLSWLLVSVEDSKTTTPWALMLFHRGEFVQLGTEEYTWHPEVERRSDGSIAATYPWPKDGESNMEASGRSTSVFTWDEKAGKVVRTGDLPPDLADSGQQDPDGTAGAPGTPPVEGASPYAGGSSVPPGTRTLASRDVGGTSVASFVMPSTKIGCDFTAAAAGCGVEWYIEDSTAGDSAGFGPSWWVDLGAQGAPRLHPKGDAPYFKYPDVPKLEYGDSVQYGDYVCSSEDTGLTCWNVRTGHGAFMSREAFRPF